MTYLDVYSEDASSSNVKEYKIKFGSQFMVLEIIVEPESQGELLGSNGLKYIRRTVISPSDYLTLKHYLPGTITLVVQFLN